MGCRILLALAAMSGVGGVGVGRVAPRMATRAPAPLLRRSLVSTLSAAALAAVLAPAAPARAATGVPTPAELQRLVTGYRGIQALLANWDVETTICDKFDSAERCGSPAARRAAASSNMATCSCDFNPMRVQEVMGFKSIKHPLYMADQLMIRAQPLLPGTADFETYDAAVELWTRRAEDANVMSFTSSWGEANPGGGRDAVLRYLDRSHTEVEESAKLLKTIISFLPVQL
jgi:hypothetical protein